MILSDLQWIFALNVSRLTNWCQRNGYKITFGEVFRPEQMQQWYYDHGYSDTMNSQHMKRLAIDLNVFARKEKGSKIKELTYDYDKIKPIGDYWESLNEKNRWGGNYRKPDTDHFEMKE